MQKILNDPEPFVDEMLEGILAAHPTASGGRRPASHRPGRRAGRGQGRHRDRRRIGPPAAVHGLRRRGTGRRRGDRQRLRVAQRRPDAGGDAGDPRRRRRPVHVRQLRRRRPELRPGRGARRPTRASRCGRCSAPTTSHPPRRSVRGPSPRHRRHLLPVQGRRGAGGRGGVARTRSSRSPSGPPRTCARWAWRSRRASSRRPGVPTFELPAGRWRSGWASTASRASGAARSRRPTRSPTELTAAILDDLPYRGRRRVAVLVNGLGATPKEELYILYRRRRRVLDARGLDVHRVWVGEYATSLEMAGASISLSGSTTS